MPITDHVDVLISDTGIHGGPLAWKLSTSVSSAHLAAKVFSFKFFNAVQRAANRDAAPTKQANQFVPKYSFRSAFGEAPEQNDPIKKG